MKGRGVLFGLMFILFVSFACASIDVHNNSLVKTYSSGEKVSGGINMSIFGEDLNQDLTSSLGGSMSLKLFLDRNDAENSLEYSCSPVDCEAGYSAENVSTAKTFELSSGDSKMFGFNLTGNGVEVLDLSIDVSSDFAEGNAIPLRMKFFDGGMWEFLESSEDYTRSESYGCYDSTATLTEYDIGSNPYCERISIPRTGSMELGAVISGTDTETLKMVLYDGGISQECTILPGDSSCIIEGDFAEEEYLVCVKADEDTDYKISSETTGVKCGSFGINFPVGGSTIDYGIYARTPKYAAASDVTIDEDALGSVISDANQFLQNKYYGDCSSGCVLYVEVSGINQSLDISNVILRYLSSSGQLTENKLYDIFQESEVSFDAEGVFDLGLLDFNLTGSGNKTLEISIGGEIILDEIINLFSGITINQVYPSSFAAGVPTVFLADVGSDLNVSSYRWLFGDGEVKVTNEEFVTHTYTNISDYTLTLEVTDFSGGKVSKDFILNAGSPKEVINESLDSKRDSLNSALSDLNGFPVWYKAFLMTAANINFYQSELSRLENARNNAVDDEDFLDIALDLQDLNVPSSVFFSEVTSSPLFTNLDDIDPTPIQLLSGGSEEDLSKWKNPILEWQRQNTEATVSSKKVSILKVNGQREDVLRVLKVDLKVSDDHESYFIIQEKREDLFFKSEDSSIRREGDNTAIILEGLAEKSLEFYISGAGEPVLYISPKFSLLPTPGEIGVCNYNNVCEKNLDENYKNCRNDCKPFWRTIIYIIVIVLIGLILYTALQVWYKTRYETFLFRDRRYLFNLVMFINNAVARGVSEGAIRKELKKQKWSGEQITYAIKKAKGQRTGMYELIPVEMLFAFLRRRKAEKNIVTGNQQQNLQNINKQGIQRIDKW